MGKKVIKKTLILGMTLFVMTACNYVTPIKELENLLNIDLSKKDVSFTDRQEQWIGPDEYKIETFDVINSDCLSDKKHRMLQYDSVFVENRYKTSEIYKYVKNTAGYYFETKQENKEEFLFFDTINNKLYYYLIII